MKFELTIFSKLAIFLYITFYKVVKRSKRQITKYYILSYLVIIFPSNYLSSNNTIYYSTHYE